MNTFRLYNRLLGWLVFLIAAVVYLITAEPTTSLWDCGEFIASAYKLQVGHPPGAPFFMIMARVFTLFTTDVTKVAYMVNSMSAIVSALTIMFLFWSITHLLMKFIKSDKIEGHQLVAILGSGLVGSLAYTFSDTFWFSAVEGEVYASSSLFTALVFWAILKWENEADHKYANRWIVLIAYLMGLSIGVHLLNLLAIPAIVLVYYFKKYQVTRNGLIAALIVAVVLLASVMYVLIPGVIWLASMFELLFVNGFGMHYNSGVLIYAILLISGLIFGIIKTQQNKRYIANTILLAITVIIVGYSSYSMIVIRSLANPPMDENSPETVFLLQSYLNREQYGDRPLFKGQYFNAQVQKVVEGKPRYTKKDGRYEITDRKVSYSYDSRYTTFFPRMYSSNPEHINVYLEWAGIKESDVFQVKKDAEGNPQRDRSGKIVYDRTQPRAKPSFSQNIRFFVNYQVWHMYMRYFMWNFVGRQNDTQGHGGYLNGNWISGIPGIDKARLGENSAMPDDIKNHAARNTYYFLPLLLGLAGLYFHAKQKKKDFWVVMTLFILTGLAIVIYLNQNPIQPRERDYAYAGSFYAFAIWIGIGVYALIEWFGKFLKNVPGSLAVTLACLLLVPGIMASENWDDHDRSSRYVARDLAYNYLNSCAPNAIIFTNGDNDTFPLWYAQEVEGIRTDVRVVNLMLLNMDWYIDQMKRKAYDSEALPISLEPEQYITGTRDMVYVHEKFKDAYSAKEIMDFVASENPRTKLESQAGKKFDFLPTRNFYVPVDSSKVIANGTVKAKDAGQIVKQLNSRLSGGHMGKSDLIVFDILANNNWERPIYYVSTGHKGTLGLEKYLQLEGFAYRLVPIETRAASAYERGRIDTEILYNNLMNVYRYSRMNEPDVYLDNFHQRSLNIVRMRFRFNRLANKLMEEGDSTRAEEVIDRIVELTPHEQLPFDMFVPGLAETYYKLNNTEKGDALFEKMLIISDEHLEYYFAMPRNKQSSIRSEIEYHLRILGNIATICQQYNNQTMATNAIELYRKHEQNYQ